MRRVNVKLANETPVGEGGGRRATTDSIVYTNYVLGKHLFGLPKHLFGLPSMNT